MRLIQKMIFNQKQIRTNSYNHKRVKKKSPNLPNTIESDKEELNESFKRLLSITDNDNRSKKIKNKSINYDMDDFFLHIPNWGGSLVDENNNLLQIEIRDTCTIDYLLLAFWFSSKLSNKPISFLKETVHREKADYILKIIKNIESNSWNATKSIWIQNILKIQVDLDKKNPISLFGCENEFFFKHIKEFQNYELTLECSSDCEKILKK